jgi:hypothetical protein
MRKLLLILIVLVFKLSSAQTINSINVKDIPAKYIEVVSTAKMFKPFQVSTYISYGQISRMKDMEKGYIIDDTTGKQMIFNGTMGVLNYLDEQGFKYVNQYLVTVGGQSVYHTILENTNK